ncbi:MAG: hypothetical protein JW884_14625 [Deltaproteobacteria bacterium]|nr:hypothetical protein [Deltaproteobacteria bacterium]
MICLFCFAFTLEAIHADDQSNLEAGVNLTDLSSVGLDMVILENFSGSASSAWSLKSGVEVKLDFGIRLPGITGEFLRVEGFKNSPSSREIGRAWFSLSRPVEPEQVWEKAEGIRVVLGLRSPGKWWLSVGVTCDGEVYNAPLLPYEYIEPAIVDRIVRFTDMVKNGKHPDPTKITNITFGGAVEENVLYLDKLALVRSPEQSGWLIFSTSRPGLNLFERGEEVKIYFAPGGQAPPEAAGVRYVIHNYWGKRSVQGQLMLSNEKTQYSVDLGVMPPGYYEVQAHWIDMNERVLDPDSSIKATGSVPFGLGIFAVLANTAEESLELFRKHGQSAFLGLHGDRFGLANLCGLSWRNEYWKWLWIEPVHPDRSGGMAAWAGKMIADGPATVGVFSGEYDDLTAASKTGGWPAYRSHISSSRANIGDEVPPWARKAEYRAEPAPAYKEWPFFLDMFKDYIEVEKVRYPHLKPRLYDVAWEVNLNYGSGCFLKPNYNYDDVVELYRKSLQVLRETDPDGILIGPCYSSLLHDGAIESHEELFKRGLLKYIDAINTHAYHTPPPEKVGIPEKTTRLNQMMASYNNGKQLPIYCTELGYRSRYGTMSLHREQAQWLTRVATIFKGEGWRAFLPFYIHDTGDTEGYGICFNPQLKPNPHSSKSLFPKPAVPALAVWAHILEGTTPVRHLRFFGEDVWGYTFSRAGQAILVLWTVERQTPLMLPVGEVKETRIVDFMGVSKMVKPDRGVIQLELVPAPQYISNVSDDIYLHFLSSENDADVFTIHAGQTREIKLPLPTGAQLRTASAEKSDIQVKALEGQSSRIQLSAPAKAKCGPRSIRIEYADKMGQTHVSTAWCVLRPSIQMQEFGMVLVNGKPNMRLELVNVGVLSLPVNIELNADGVTTGESDITIAPDKPWIGLLPLPLKGLPDPQRRMKVKLTISTHGDPPLSVEQEINFLGASPKGAEMPGQLPSRATIAGRGSSGRTDTAQLAFAWDASSLYLNVESHDDIFFQEKTDGNIWQHDSLQIAMDSHPEQKDVYNPVTSIFTKRIVEVGAALTPKGPIAWRHRSFDKNRLGEGDASKEFPMVITRDEEQQITRYELTLPWAQLGFEPEWIEQGKVLGISVLVNDSDGVGLPRKGLEFFSGIMHDKTHAQYGRLTLK